MRSCLFVVFIVAGVFAQQPDSLTIDKAVDIVLKRHPSISQAKEALEAARAHTRGLQSLNYPSVNGVVSYAHIYPDDPISLFGFSAKFMPENNYDMHLGADYNIFDFGKRSTTLEIGKVSEVNAAQSLQSLKQDLSYQVLKIFTTIIFQEKSLLVADEGIAELDRHLVDVRKKIDAGSATEYDALKTEVQRAGAQSQRTDIATDLEKTRIALRQLLGMKPDASLILKGEFDTLNFHCNTDSLMQNALANRSDHLLAKNAKELAGLNKKNAEIKNLPVLGANASAGIKNGFLPNIDKLRFNVVAGCQVTMPIYDGSKTKSDQQEAARNEKSSEASLKSIDESIKTDMLQATTDVKAAFSKLEISRSQVAFAQRSLELARLKYDAGVVTNLDVLDAENDFSQAKLGHLRNQYQYTQSIYMLDKAIGRMRFTEQ
jgi:outer membrane protein